MWNTRYDSDFFLKTIKLKEKKVGLERGWTTVMILPTI